MRRLVAAAALAALLGAGCGGGGSEEAEPAAAVAGAQADPAAYDALIAALGRARIHVAACPGRAGGANGAIHAGAGDLPAGAAHLRYTDGRLYELGPCDTPPDQRTLLRIYHFRDEAARDAAVQAYATRGIRATAAWTYQSEFTVELWQNDPADTGPVGQAASAAHLAIGAVPGIRHV